MELAKNFLKSMFEREDRTPLSRRDALAGLGLVGALLAAPKLLAVTPAEASPLDQAANVSGSASEVAKADEVGATDAGDATDLSARRYWRRRYYRPYLRRRYYWRRRYYRPYLRRRYWRRRYWRRRYW
jgi:hypothetical protein